MKGSGQEKLGKYLMHTAQILVLSEKYKLLASEEK